MINRAMPSLKIIAFGVVMLSVPPVAVKADVPVVPDPEEYRLSEVEDDVWLRHTDTPAYYGLLHHAGRVPPDRLRAAGAEFVRQRAEQTGLPTFVDMLRNSSAYQGQPVLLRGHILQTQRAAALDNPYGIETIYESSLFIDDSQGNLTTVVFLEKPEGLPIGGELVDGVEVAGYFLKLYWYPAGDQQTHKAPLILAHTVTVRPPAVHGPLVPPRIAYPLLLIGFVVLVAIVWSVQRSDRKRLIDRREQELEQRRPDFTAIDSEDGPRFGET